VGGVTYREMKQAGRAYDNNQITFEEYRALLRVHLGYDLGAREWKALSAA
jgi:hypothetical protein